MGWLLFRYLAAEMVVPFFSWLAGIVVVLLGNYLFLLLKQAEGRAIPWDVAVRYVVFQAPFAIVLAVPMAFLFSMCLAITRLGKDGELLGMRMAGMGPWGILTPFWVIGLLLVCCVFGVYDQVVPRSTSIAAQAFRNVFQRPEQLKDVAGTVIRSRDTGEFFYADGADEATGALTDIVVCQSFDASFPEFIVAKSATLEGQVLRLQDACLYTFDSDGFFVRSFSAKTIDYDQEDRLPERLAEFYGDEHTIGGMRAEIEELKAGGRPYFRQVYEIHNRAAIPFACFAFALVAGPLAVSKASGGSFTGMLLAMASLTLYYPLLASGKVLGNSGRLDPVLAAWMPNVVFVIIGGILTARSR